MLTPLQQAFEYIKKSKNILIALPEYSRADAVAGGLALFRALKKMEKKISIVAIQPVIQKLKFLPSIEEIKSTLPENRDFIINIGTKGNKIEKINYESTEDNLKLILSSQAQISQKQILCQPGPFKYNLIITVGAVDLEALGNVYEQNTELFFNQPILNIDYQAANENYGQINLIDSTASSSSEIISQLIESLGRNLIDEAIATCLLTGLMDETRSFQSRRTRPQTLTLASILINQGAEKENITKWLYQSKPLNCLKLWGQAVSNLEVLKQPRSLLLFIKESDFSKTATSPQNLNFVLEESIENFPDFDFWIILWPQKSNLHGLVQTTEPGSLIRMPIEGEKTIRGNKLIFVLENKTIKEGQEIVKNLLKGNF